LNRHPHRVRAAITIAALAVGVLSAATPLAAAATTSKVPFTDPNVDGWLTFCSRSNQPVRSGSIDTAPFAWKTISSSAPPAGYQKSSGRVTLYAYQPIQYVDPGDWSGSELTGASAFSSPEHPVVQATNVDQPLLGFTQAYPLHWDGLVEIRMMYTAVNEPEIQMPYAAAVLRVTGSKWSLVKGGEASCSQGKGLSMETVLLPKKDLEAHPSASPSGSAGGAGGSTGSGGSSSGGKSSSADGSAANLAANGTSGMSAGALAGVGVGALVLVWAGIFVVGRLRRRSAS
jgi:hypothetical protein